jgi:GTPase
MKGNMSKTRCGIVAIIGEPNAGKSTLINKLVGGKVSIVTPKVQTTRFNIRGVCVHEASQLIFVDTPGIFTADKAFEKAMVQAAWAGIGDADAVLLLLDAKQGLRDSTRQLIETLKKNCKKTVCLALNKIDAVKKETLFELASACDNLGSFERVFMISALKGSGIDDVKAFLAAKMPESPWLYPEDQMSDISLRLLAAEVTREKIFLKLEQELPYAIFVETESWDETESSVKIAQVVTVQREGQKKIVIGDKGTMIKHIGIAARKELERMLDKKVHLALFVKVRPGWKDDSENYRLLGLEYKK